MPTLDVSGAPYQGSFFSGQGFFWTSEYGTSVDLFFYVIDHWNAFVNHNLAENYTVGMSVRCIKNTALGLRDNTSELRKSYVYPNPFSSTATLVLNNTLDGELRVRILDVTGKTVKEFREPASSTLTIDSNGLAEGFYIYSVTASDNRTLNGKFVVKR